MSKITFKANYIELGKIFEQKIDSDSRIGAFVDDYVKNRFQKNKNLLLSEFNNHKITVELRNGPAASNISDTLGGNGNLFSFLGFFQTKNPTIQLEDLLSSISIRKTTRKGKWKMIKHKVIERRKMIPPGKHNAKQAACRNPPFVFVIQKEHP